MGWLSPPSQRPVVRHRERCGRWPAQASRFGLAPWSHGGAGYRTPGERESREGAAGVAIATARLVLGPADLLLGVPLDLEDFLALLVVDVGLVDVESTVGDLLELEDPDLLGPLIHVFAGTNRLNFFIEPLLKLGEQLLGLVLGRLGLVLAGLDERLVLGLEQREGLVRRPSLAEGDERVVTGEDVDAVEHEGHVVEVEVLGSSACGA